VDRQFGAFVFLFGRQRQRGLFAARLGRRAGLSCAHSNSAGSVDFAGELTVVDTEKFAVALA
jgi:hypothetical protein